MSEVRTSDVLASERFHSAQLALNDFRQFVRKAVDNPKEFVDSMTPEVSRAYYTRRVAENDRILSLLPDSLSEDEKVSIATEAFVLATYIHDTYGHHKMTLFITPTQISQVLRERYDGVTLVQAYALSFGYPEQILDWNADEVRSYYRLALSGIPRKLPWDVLREWSEMDVDAALVSSLLASSDITDSEEVSDVEW